MTPQISSEAQLRAENSELRARLEEAEDTLRAIRHGEVEALIVETADGPQIFTLQGLDAESNRFRGEILAQVSDAVIAVDADQRVTYLNAAAERQYRVPASNALGRQLSEIFTPQWPRAEMEAAMWAALREHGEWRSEITHRTHDDRELAVESSVTALCDASGLPAGYVAVIRDITERKRAAAALAEIEAQFRAAFEQSAVGMAQLSAQTGRFVRVNAKFCEMIGYSAEELAGMMPAGLTFTEDREADAKALGQMPQGETADHEVEKRYVRKDGEIIWVHVTATLMRDAAGRPERTMAIIQNITARKQAEEQLRASEVRVSGILSSITDGFHKVDSRCRFTEFNDAARTMYAAQGMDADALVGKHVWDEAFPDGRSTVIETALNETLIKRTPTAYETFYAPWQCWFHVRNFPTADGGVATFFQDITERVRAEAEIRGNEELVRTIAENSTQAMVMMDDRGFVIYCNQVLLNLTGYNAEEIRSARLHDLIHHHYPDGRPYPMEECPIDRALPEDFSVRAHEDLFFRKDGSSFEALCAASPIFKDGKPVSTVIELRDVTAQNAARRELIQTLNEQKEAESALNKAMQEAQRSARAKDDFLAALSHELRTPLTPVLMMATALENDPTLTQEVRDQLAMMRRNIELEARLIDDLLDLTRISRGKLVIDRQLTDVHQLMDHTAEIVRSDRLGEEVPIVFTHEAARHHALADGTRLQQVFWNLIKNALKFTPPGGNITVRTRNDEAGRIVISVVDTGLGISREALPNILKAFEQGDVSGQHRYGGLGLGLAISKAIIDVHGGTLLAESPGPGRGATFTVALDSAEAPAPLSPAAAAPPSPPRALRLLVVEDHETTRMVLAHLLTNRGHQVTTAGCVQEALAAFAADHFDGIISDLGLPDGSGLDLMKQIQSQRPIPAIALSGYGMENDLRRTKEAGFFAHLVKPVNLDQLRQLIDQITPSLP